MRVICACEESQAVCIAFREKGHEAYSCDIQECSGSHPEWHLHGDIWDFATDNWDMCIAFPPCTHLSAVCANQWKKKQEDGRQQEAIEFVKKLWNFFPKIAIENPVGILSTVWQKPTQIIHPFYFGDPYLKRTCLWLKGLPALIFKKDLFNTNDTIVKPVAHWISCDNKSCRKLPALHRNSKLRSKTFPGIAAAMAEQWGKF